MYCTLYEARTVYNLSVHHGTIVHLTPGTLGLPDSPARLPLPDSCPDFMKRGSSNFQLCELMRTGSLVLVSITLTCQANQVLVNIVSESLRESNVVAVQRTGPYHNAFRCGSVHTNWRSKKFWILLVINFGIVQYNLTADIVCF